MLYFAFILVAAGGLAWLALRRPHPRRWLLPRRPVALTTAAVDRQHRHLQAGGLLGETACEAAKAHFRELLSAGRADDVSRELQPGLDFAVRVRALTEIGTTEAAELLARQLTRSLSVDPVEQSWYWVDVAAGLRRLNHTPALPAVLRCADAAAELPPGAQLAAEAVAFSGFASALKQSGSAVGRAALRALVRTARAAREGTIDLGAVVRAGLGDALADVSAKAESADPWLALAVIEAERVFRRLGHWAIQLPPDDRVCAEQQAMRLWASGERRGAWLAGAADRLLARFVAAGMDEQGSILQCLFELRADVTPLFPHLPDLRATWWADAIRALRWSKSAAAGPVLAGLAERLTRKPRSAARAVVVLEALRGHACHESESALLKAASASDAAVRTAAASSLGWWPPFDPDRVVRALRVARTDADTRSAAVGALARLGERSALSEVSAGLDSEEPAIRVSTSSRIATEELSWLWPDLETATTSEDTDTALAAGEAVERLRELLFGLVG